MHTLTLTLNAATPLELETQLRSLRVALVRRRDDLIATKQTLADQSKAPAYQYRIDFLDSVVEQMFTQEEQWMRQAREAGRFVNKVMEG